MVSFICDACQETVRKNQVENHYKFKCKNCWTLSCVDCSVSFEGDSYAAHTSCISEAEKYQGALYQKAKKNVKADPQERWTNMIKRISFQRETIQMSAEAKKIFEHILDYDNVPRKEKKFANFLNNTYHVRQDSPLCKEIWGIVQKGWAEDKVQMDQLVAEQKKAKEVAKQSKDESSEKKMNGDSSENGKDEERKGWKKQVRVLIKSTERKKMKVKDLQEQLKKQKFKIEKEKLKQYLKSKPNRFEMVKDDKAVKLK